VADVTFDASGGQMSLRPPADGSDDIEDSLDPPADDKVMAHL
jgi:hypothetical protein